MSLLLNKAHFPVEVLGHGRRVGLWLQGCTIRCFGCISRDTWVADPSMSVDVAEVLAWLAALPEDQVDGITISGGEPFDQPEALTELLSGISAWRREIEKDIDVLCYSGRGLDELERDFAGQLALLDAVVPEPFVHDRPTRLPLRGSDNQQVVALTDLGRIRYEGAGLSALAGQRGQMQVEVDGESIWFIGIPDHGAMTLVRERAAAAGIQIRRPSWLI